MANKNMSLKLILDLVQKGSGAKNARKELQGVKKEADALRSARGPDKLDKSLGLAAQKAKAFQEAIARARAEVKALNATPVKPRFGGAAAGAGLARLKDMAQPKDRAKQMLSTTATGALAAGAVGLGIGGLAGGAATIGLAGKGLSESLTLEKSMFNVARATDTAGAELKAYEAQIRNLAMATGQAAPDLANMLAEAGFAGRPKQDLMDFTKYAGKAMTAWDTPAEETGKALAEIGNIYQANQKRIEEIGDAINTAADQSAAKETDLLEVLRRAGAAGRQLGISAEQTLAFGGALKEVGTQPQVIGTALNALYTNLALGDDATKEFSDGLSAIKMTSTQLQKSVRKDATGAIVELLEKIGKVPDGLKRMAILKQLFGREYADNMGALLNNLDRVKTLLNTMGDKKNYVGSVERDAQKKLQTDFNRLERAQQSMNELSRRLGDPLKVAAGSIAEGINAMLSSYDKLEEAKKKVDEAAKRLAEGNGTTSDIDTLANDPQGLKKLGQATREKVRIDNQNDYTTTTDQAEAIGGDQGVKLQIDQERRNLEREIAAIELQMKAGATAGQRLRLGQLKMSLSRLPEAPATTTDRQPADAAERMKAAQAQRVENAANEKMAKEKEAEIARLKTLRDIAPDGPSRQAAADRLNTDEIEKRGEGGFSRDFRSPPAKPANVPVPPIRPAELIDKLNPGMQETGGLIVEQLAQGVEAKKGRVVSAVEGVKTEMVTPFNAMDLSSGASTAMDTLASTITSKGDNAVAAARNVVQRVNAELSGIKAPSVGGGPSLAARHAGRQHD